MSKNFARALLSSVPWLCALFVLYQLETQELWQPETPFRALASVLILALGLAGSFLINTVLHKRL